MHYTNTLYIALFIPYEEQIYLIIFDYPNIYYIIFYKVVKA